MTARPRTPPRRSRWRTLLKWTGTLACLLILLATAACLRWRYIAWSDGLDWGFGVEGGSVHAVYGQHSAIMWPRGLQFGGSGSRGVADLWSECALRPIIRRRQGVQIEGWIPLWMPFVLIGLPTAWLWWRDRRRVPSGCCAACGYDLTGNVTGRCPECGALREVRSPNSEV